MKWTALLFIFYIITHVGIIFLFTIAGLWHWAYRKVNGNSEMGIIYCIVNLAVAHEHFCQLVANSYGFIGPRPQYTMGYALSYWWGEAALMAAAMYLNRSIFKRRGRHDS